MNAVFLDTVGLVALWDEGDQWHSLAEKAFDSILSQRKPMVTIILADPQRMIRAGAHAVDGCAKENGFTVLFVSGNLALREMWERLRDDQSAKVILVDRSREKAKLPLFYADMAARGEKGNGGGWMRFLGAGGGKIEPRITRITRKREEKRSRPRMSTDGKKGSGEGR